MVVRENSLQVGVCRIDGATFSEVLNETSSDGAESKFTADGKWVKVDTLGYSALTEVLGSRLALALEIPTVVYEPCFFVQGKWARSACISNDYNSSAYEVVTLARLIRATKSNSSFEETLRGVLIQPTVELRIKAVYAYLSTLSTAIRGADFYSYLAKTFFLDYCLYNYDRHLNNILLARTKQRIRSFLVFDYGAGLLSNTQKYPLEIQSLLEIEETLASIAFKPFSVRFGEQWKVLSDYYVPPSEIEIVVSDLKPYWSEAEYIRALQVLQLGTSRMGLRLKML